MRKFVLVVAVVLVAAVSAGVAHSASSQSAGSLVGTWARTTTCAQLASAFRGAGITKLVNEMVVGNGFIPGVQNPDQLRDPARPCLGAVPRKHSHFFLKNGEFGSLDWNGDPVDDGRYRVSKPGTVTIFKEFPKVTFRYKVRGKGSPSRRSSRRAARRSAVPGRSRSPIQERPGSGCHRSRPSRLRSPTTRRSRASKSIPRLAKLLSFEDDSSSANQGGRDFNDQVAHCGSRDRDRCDTGG